MTDAPIAIGLAALAVLVVLLTLEGVTCGPTPTADSYACVAHNGQ